MAHLFRATVSTIAESLGIPHIKESVYTQLSNDAQRKILLILGESLQYCAARKGKCLSGSDVNMSLESYGLQPILGLSGVVPKIVSAGKWNALELLFYEDRQIILDKNMRLELKPYPVASNFDIEWLAVVGTRVGDEDEDADMEAVEPAPLRISLPDQAEQDSDMNTSRRSFSYELQILYRTVKGGLVSDDPVQCEQMLRALRTEDYLQGLLPDYLRLGQQLLRDNARIFGKLYVAVSLARAICCNPEVKFLDSYLPQLMTIGLSVLLSSNLLPKSLYEQIVLQEYAADLLRVLVELAYERTYVLVQPRLTEQLVSVLEMSENVVEKVGAMTAILNLGLETVAGYGLPPWRGVLNQAAALCNENEVDKHDLGNYLYEMELKSAGFCFHADTYRMWALGMSPFGGYSGPRYRELMDGFGEDLIPYVIDDSCFLYL
jgi:histone H3/H4